MKDFRQRGSRRVKASVAGSLGGQFEVHTRRSIFVPEDWSVVLRYMHEGYGYRLLRLNGPAPLIHKNRLTGEMFDSVPHMHRATAAAQRRGFAEDQHAIPVGHFVLPARGSQGFTTMEDALRVFARKIKLGLPDGQMRML
jgi:hypothetical protein